MKIKSYFSDSVEQAIQKAREELGSEAMLVTTRRASPEARKLGAYEVVFGVAPRTDKDSEPSAHTRLDADGQTLSSELQTLRAQLDDIKRTLQLSGARGQGVGADAIEELCADLLAADLDGGVARHIAEEAAQLWQSGPETQGLRPRNESRWETALGCIRGKLRFGPDERDDQPANRVMVFVGPPGAGKTTTLTKVAVRQCLARRASARIISVDPYRVAAHEKLRSFAGIIGIGFTAASTIREFTEAVDEFHGKSYLLIDTPGFSDSEIDGARDLIDCLRRIRNRETHLALPASMKRADLLRTIRHFEIFDTDYLLFTKLDETESFGAIISAALQTNKRVSFFGTGQNIPEDLAVANADSLIQTLFTREIAAASTAA